MNNIFLPNDPLLYNSGNSTFQNVYEQKLQRDKAQLEQQYAEYMNSLRQQSQQYPDKLSELNNKIGQLDPEIKQQLMSNDDFISLNKTLQDNVQEELVALIKNKINGNSDMVSNIDKQIEIIKNLETNVKENNRKNMSEINDYLQHYSHMTFDEYKKLKNVNYED